MKKTEEKKIYPKGDRSIFATHVVPLTRVIDKSEGDVLEIGTGWFSTLLLHWLAEVLHRHVYSYESSRHWYKRAKKYNSKYHHIVFCENWDEIKADKHWGVVFIDHSPDKRRIVEIEKFANHCDYMVIHDTEPERDWYYEYSKVLKLFKYRFDYKKGMPWTSVVSNFKSLKNL